MMRGRSVLGFGLVFCFILTATCALGDDLVPPPWRGCDNTTYQAWEFSDASNPAAPDVVSNPYGTPVATVYGEFELPYRDSQWLEETFFDHYGVWQVGVSMSLEIPNDPILRPQKIIRLQMTYDGGCTETEPRPYIDVYATDGAQTIDSELIEQTRLDEYYVHDTYEIILEPNPSSETIWITPYYCDVYIDEIVVDTICVPEPSALFLLIAGAAGLLAVFRRRRIR